MTPEQPRTFLFLQGPPGPFARELGMAIRAHGHKALRVNLCAGDWLLWRGAGTVCYRGTLGEWHDWLSDFVRGEGVTDILYYADQHPYHRAALQVAKAHDIPAYVYEYGYLRPNFITLERGGMSTYSHVPNDPSHILALDDGSLPDPDFRNSFPHVFISEASREVLYNVLSWVYRPLFFPGYEGDRVYNPLHEYLSHVPRLLARPLRERRARRLVDDLVAGQTDYWVLPLQLEIDYQLRRHSPFAHMTEAVEQIVASFARHAPVGARLVVKMHPLQCGVVPWRQLVGRLARQHGVGERVDFIDGGNLETLLRHARGTVLVNSTVGLHAFRYGCPVKVLGVAVFNLEGLTFQGSLDDFWEQGQAPDPELRQAFIRVLAATTQLKGSFFNPAGRAHAIEEMVQRLLGRRVNEPGAFVDPPPRLESARAAGVPV